MTIPQSAEPVVTPTPETAVDTPAVDQNAESNITLTIPEEENNPLADPKPDAVDPKDSGEKPTDSPDEPEAFDFEVPETLNLDDATTAKLKETARDLGLKPDQVQKLLESAGTSLTEANDTMLKETREGWAKEIANDAKLGGDKLPESMAIADKAVAAFGDEGLTTLLSAGELPLGKEPSVFRFLAKIGAAISDSKAVTPGVTSNPVPKPIEGDAFNDVGRASEIMYPNK